MGTLQFRLFVRRCCKEASKRALARDTELRDACCEAAYGRYERSAGGDLITFLEWLLDHADEIIALIEKIIGLFTGVATEAAT